MSMIQTSLPIPSKTEIEHSLKLIDHLKSILKQHDGKMSFMQYIAEVLYAKGLGYYASGAHKLGEKGDFMTAPLLSPAFSFCLGKFCARVLADLDDPVILEIGAGTGDMAANILIELARQSHMPSVYYILETSPDLKQRQRETIKRLCPDYFHLVKWVTEPLKKPFNGVIVANELLDALPVFRFEKKANEVVELGVAMDKGRFKEINYSTSNIWLNNAVQAIEKNIGELPEGYCSEINLTLKPWLEATTQALASGLCLFIDYGYTQKRYYDPSRVSGTLSCYYKHLTHDDPFVYPGLQDITAHVDFTHLANCAEALSFDVAGFSSQNQWLTAMGIHAYASMLRQNAADEPKMTKAVNKLLSPAFMGEQFQVMALVRNFTSDVPGFKEHDCRYKL